MNQRRTAQIVFLVLLAWAAVCVSCWATPQPIESRVVPAQGQRAEKTTFNIVLRNGSKVDFTPPPGQLVASAPQYLQITFFNNSIGYQAIIISTDNRSKNANPRYTGTGTGAGLVRTDGKIDVPLHWVVFDDPVPGGYKFVPGNGEPIDTRIQFFVCDKQQDKASWHPSPFDPDYASVIFGIADRVATLAKAPKKKIRQTTDGKVFVYLGANFTGKPAGWYGTNTLRVELVTIKRSQYTVLRSFTVPVK